MIALIIIAAMLVCLATYFLVGWRLAVRDLPNAWERARANWRFEDYIHGSVKQQTVCMVLFWPLLKPWRAASQRLTTAIVQNDPKEMRRRIDELERELGMHDREGRP